SPNISRRIDRDTLEVMGRVWPSNAVWKNVFTNDYGIGVAFSESPFEENTLYVGTDDGLIQITEDGGVTWRRMETFPGIPPLAYVSAVLASRHDPDRVYALFNHHKRGDFTPYVLRSDDRGRSWRSIAGDLPDRHLAWDIVEDRDNPDLLFLGTEFGLFFSLEGGGRWIELTEGSPTIPYRDLEIHEGTGDLVAATFGRGFMILDDYTPLRTFAAVAGSGEPALFQPRRARVYEPIRYTSAGSGAGEFTAPNPPFGAILNYYLPAAVASEEGEVYLVVGDGDGETVAEVEGVKESGLQRVVWDLRAQPEEEAGAETRRRPRLGPLVPEGSYPVTLELRSGGESRRLAGPVVLRVVALGRTRYERVERRP
ncbi:MAG: WD40/YVTN/BNR-like repeat-containing protein, partial [Longimicrobiales bacterium]